MADPWLTPDEVVTLTARKRWTAQCRELTRMGVAFTPNAAGRPLVPRDRVLGTTATRQPRKAAPNWSAIDGTQAKA